MKKYLVFILLFILTACIYLYINKRCVAPNSLVSKSTQSLPDELETIFNLDQKYRKVADSLKSIGETSDRVDSVYKISNHIDSCNLIRVTKILDSIGFQDHSILGGNGHNALFFVIQHADKNTREKYLPIFRDAAKNNLLPKSYLAMLEDRILLDQGKKQIYGTQIGFNEKTNAYYVLPLQDPDSVDVRRFRAELGHIALYLLNYQLTWDIAQYKKDLAEIEKLEKVRRK